MLPNGKAEGALFSTNTTLQLSDVTGVPKLTPVAVQPLLVLAIFVGGQIIVGSTMSTTITDCMQVLTFPDPSVTDQVTIVLSIGKIGGALLFIDVIEQLSDVVGVPRDIPEALQPELVPAIICKGQFMVGKILSITVMVS